MIADIEGDFKDLINGVPTPDELPILAVRNLVLFPGVVSPILIGRESSSTLIKRAEKKQLVIGIVCQRDGTIVLAPVKIHRFAKGYLRHAVMVTVEHKVNTGVRLVRSIGRPRLEL